MKQMTLHVVTSHRPQVVLRLGGVRFLRKAQEALIAYDVTLGWLLVWRYFCSRAMVAIQVGI